MAPPAALHMQGQEPLTASMLAEAPPQEQKQMLGERLFPLIASMYPDMAGKITGMLLEIDNSELLHMLESRESLKAKVRLINNNTYDYYFLLLWPVSTQLWALTIEDKIQEITGCNRLVGCQHVLKRNHVPFAKPLIIAGTGSRFNSYYYQVTTFLNTWKPGHVRELG